MSDVVLGQVKELLAQLTPAEKAEVVAWLGAALKAELPQGARGVRHSARGLWTDLGKAPSDEAIDEARRALWGNFPRDDV
jgi:hypothetical protein